MGGSLYYSEVAHYTPCALCWYQRIAMYPLVLLLGIAAFRRDIGIRLYAIPLAAIGAVISAYHYLLEWGIDVSRGACVVGDALQPGVVPSVRLHQPALPGADGLPAHHRLPPAPAPPRCDRRPWQGTDPQGLFPRWALDDRRSRADRRTDDGGVPGWAGHRRLCPGQRPRGRASRRFCRGARSALGRRDR